MIGHAGVCSFSDSSNNELIFVRGEGGYVYNKEKKKYYDFVLGYGPVVLGHGNQVFNDKVCQMLSNGIHFPSYSVYHEQYVEGIITSDYDAVSFYKTSSESITAAIRLATNMTNKKGIIRCGFIGWHDCQIAETISWHEYLDSPLRKRVRYVKGFRGTSNDEKVYNWWDFNIDTLNKYINSGLIGMFIIDAFQLHLSNYDTILQAIKICKKNDILVIFDETKTSGRCSLTGIHSSELGCDMLVLGKALANGAPLSLLVSKSDLIGKSKEVRVTGTFSKEALSIYCAIATKAIMEENDGYEKLGNIGKNICKLVNSVILSLELTGYVKCIPVFNGCMFDLKFNKDIVKDTNARNMLKKYFVDNNILMLVGHPSFVCLMHSEIDFKDLSNKLYSSFQSWKEYLNNSKE